MKEKRWEVRLTGPAYTQRYRQAVTAINASLKPDTLMEMNCGGAVQWVRTRNVSELIYVHNVYCDIFQDHTSLVIDVGVRSLHAQDLIDSNSSLVQLVSVLQELEATEQATRSHGTLFQWKLDVPYEDLEEVFKQIYELF